MDFKKALRNLKKVSRNYLKINQRKGFTGIMKKENWYRKNIESSVRPLVKLLRENGFNTTCSCGHLPNPYIEMSWFADSDITRLYNLLEMNGYKNFVICGRWDTVTKIGKTKMNHRFIDLHFYFKLPLAGLSDIKHWKPALKGRKK